MGLQREEIEKHDPCRLMDARDNFGQSVKKIR